MPNLLLFLLILTNAGGEGKTTLAYLIRAVFELAGLEDYSLDADQGNWALTNKLGDRVDHDRLTWEKGAEVAGRIVAKANGRPVCMDTGANMLVAFSPISNLVSALRRRFAAAGYRTAVLFPLTPNKSGGAGGINQLVDKVEEYEKFIVLNHRDLSKSFGKVRDDVPTLQVQHLASGLQALLIEREIGLVDAILRPEPGYNKAAQHIGEWVRQFCLDDVVRSLLTAKVCDTALSRLPQAPPRITSHLEESRWVTDSAIDFMELMTLIKDLIFKHGWTSAGLRAAADELDTQPGCN